MRGVAQIATLVALAALPQLVRPGVVRAQNQLVNPDFHTDLAGWTTDVDWIDGFFDAEDYAGAAESGSARIVNTREIGDAEGLHQCVAIPEADGTTAWDMTVQSRVSVGQGFTGTSVLALWFVANGVCDIVTNGEVLASIAPSNGLTAWNEVGSRNLAIPAGTRSIRFDLRVQKVVDGGSYEAHFDHAYLPEPPGATLAAIVALLALQRRR